MPNEWINNLPELSSALLLPLLLFLNPSTWTTCSRLRRRKMPIAEGETNVWWLVFSISLATYGWVSASVFDGIVFVGSGLFLSSADFLLLLQTICPFLGLRATDRKQCQEFVIIVTPWICSHFKAHTNPLQFVDTVSPLFLTEQTMYYELHP